MTSAVLDVQTPAPPNPAHDLEEARTGVAQRVFGAIQLARTGAGTLGERLPGAVHATRAGALEMTSALQRLPDSTLRWIAATSVGLGAGLRLAGAPRLVSAAGAAPALLVGAVIALRPTEPVAPIGEHADTSAKGMIDMTHEHTKGTVSKATGTIEEGLGTLTGDKEMQVHGKAKQVQGNAQKGLGEVRDAIRGPKRQDKDGA